MVGERSRTIEPDFINFPALFILNPTLKISLAFIILSPYHKILLMPWAF